WQKQNGDPVEHGEKHGIHGLRTKRDPEELTTLVHDFFRAAGVTLEPPKSVFFNDRTGMLMVRATTDDLNLVEQALHVLSISPAQLTIETKICEISEDDESALGFHWLLDWVCAINSVPPLRSGVLTAPQFRTVMKVLPQRTDVLTLTKITTLSARQAQITVPVNQPFQIGRTIDVVPY